MSQDINISKIGHSAGIIRDSKGGERTAAHDLTGKESKAPQTASPIEDPTGESLGKAMIKQLEPISHSNGQTNERFIEQNYMTYLSFLTQEKGTPIP